MKEATKPVCREQHVKITARDVWPNSQVRINREGRYNDRKGVWQLRLSHQMYGSNLIKQLN